MNSNNDYVINVEELSHCNQLINIIVHSSSYDNKTSEEKL